VAEPELAGRTAVVAGHDGAVLRAVAARFRGAGARVVLAVMPPSEAAALEADSVLSLDDAGLNPDDTSRLTPDQLVERLARELDGIHIWVNVPREAPAGPAEGIDEAAWRAGIDGVLTATFRWCQAAGRHMVERSAGVIVNVVSVDAFLVAGERVLPAVTMAGVNALTRALGVEWAGRGVRVVGVMAAPPEPGRGLGDRSGSTIPEARRIPLRRYPTPDEIAEAVLFVAGDEARYITAETLRVDGGWGAYQLF